MYKYSPINSYSLRNLQKNQIFFNDPLNFNDPFDTIHPARIKELSDEKFIELYCKSNKHKFDERALLGILKRNISKQDFYAFCTEHIDYIFDFGKENQFFKSKGDFLKKLENIEETKDNFVEDIGALFSIIKLNLQATIEKTLQNIRNESLSKIGVSCFSKNNSNLIMWSHYADSHQGFCLEFNTNFEPFSKSFEVIYKSEIPDIKADLLFSNDVESEFLQKLLSFKSIDWEHEEEIRIIHQESNKSFYYPASSLKAIYFGVRANQSDIEIICSIIKSQNPTVKFYRMKKQEMIFGIESEEFYYSTVVEVQAGILLIVSKLFHGKKFTVRQLYKNIDDNITENQLEAHLEDLTKKKMLMMNKGRYSVNKN